MGVIYIATNKVNSKIYIGQTIKTLDRRKLEHKLSSLSEKYKDYDTAFHRAIRKYGYDNFTWEVLSEVPPHPTEIKDALNPLESYFIWQYQSLSNFGRGYNSNEGGDNRSHSLESRAKMSKARRGVPTGRSPSEKSKQALSKWAKERVYTDKIRKALKDQAITTHTGRKNSPETLQKMSDSAKKKTISPNFRIASKKALAKKVVNSYGQVFDSIADGARAIGVGYATVSKCCNGQLKTAGGVGWSFYKENT